MVRQLKNFYHLLCAFIALAFYRFPARHLTIIGVTGTDGKTTTVNLIYEILKRAGEKVAMVSSVSARLGEQEIDTGFHVTTPDSWPLQRLLRQIVDKGFTHVVLEATSHGLDQHRLLGCNFKVGVVTNVTHEHLDYHQTWENYLKAKAKLFKGVKIAVLNKDDKSYKYLKSKVIPQKSKILSYGIKNEADFTPKAFPFKTKLPGEYNLYNCLAAIATTKALGVNEKIIREAVGNFSGLVGRLEEIKDGQNFQVFVDFAHTPNGLENVLKTLAKLKTQNSKLITVFGCAGLRDIQKRPLMGEISSQLAEITVLTAEDPRTEDLAKIIDQIVEGCQKVKGIEGKTFFRVPARGEAIKFAIQKLARKGDIVVICGKGHEKSMCFGKNEYPWSDQGTARAVLKELKNAKKN